MALHLQQKHHHHQQQQNHGLLLHGFGTTAITSSFNLASLPITLNLFHSEIPSSSSLVELEEASPLPFGWQKCLNLKTGEIYYTKDNRLKQAKTMSRNGKTPRLDLKLNLSPPRGNRHQQVESPNGSGGSSSSPTSPPSSCVSSEDGVRCSNSPEATSMVLVGCPRCLMYVMLSEDDPKCPKCKSTVLLDFVHDNNTRKTKKN